MTRGSPPIQGITAALLTPVFLGMAPIFGKMATNAGADPFTVAALRTLIAVALMWAVYGLFFRRYIYIYPAGLIGCIIIGAINGIGSLFYYSGLDLLDASLAQLVNGSYLVFALLLTRIGGERITLQVMIRVALALAGLIIITGFSTGETSWLGVGLMMANALMFAATVIFSQYVVFEMPSPTATLYILTTMAVIVTMAWLPTAEVIPTDQILSIMQPIVLLGMSTAIARLMLFAGVKFMGSLQTAITAMAEIAVALVLAFFLLGDRLTPEQWAGVILLGLSMVTIRQEDLTSRGFNPNEILVKNMSSIQFQSIAFHHAFGTTHLDNDEQTMSSITTVEIQAIRDMMGVDSGPVDPFPIIKMHSKGIEERDGGFTVDLQEFLEDYDATHPEDAPADETSV
jgi:DME family drug/metabolite transporter